VAWAARRDSWPLYALLGALLLLGLTALDAQRRHADHAARARMHGVITQLLGSSDLALSSSSRWLRNPSQVEPAAASADAPAILDTDPAGALIPPDPTLLGQSARSLRSVPARRPRTEGTP